jgi:hypothetical protein
MYKKEYTKRKGETFMKLFKLILNCVLSVLLIVSIVLNVFLLAGFKIVREDYEPNNPEQTEVQIEVAETDRVINHHQKKDKYKKPEKDTEETFAEETFVEETFVEELTTVPNEETSVPEEPAYIIYEDNNIRVKYICFDYTRPDPTYYFAIENLSTKTLNVLFTNVCIDNQLVYISGLTCENLLPETSLVDEFVLSTEDNVSFNPATSVISFKIKLTNSKSYLDLYTTEQITFNT